MTDLTVSLPTDFNDRFFQGVGRKLPRGYNASGDFADAGAVLVDNAGNPILYNDSGTLLA